jgi:hypothetical protein
MLSLACNQGNAGLLESKCASLLLHGRVQLIPITFQYFLECKRQLCGSAHMYSTNKCTKMHDLLVVHMTAKLYQLAASMLSILLA